MGTSFASTEPAPDLAMQSIEEAFSWKTLMRLLPVGVFIADPTGRLLYVNEYSSQLAGVGVAKLLAHSWTSVLHPEDWQGVLSAYQESASKGEPWRYEYRIVRPDGEIAWIDSMAEALRDESGNVVAYLGTVTDITQRRRAEGEVIEAQSQIIQSEKLASVGQLAAGIAHEINTPIQYVGDNIRALSDSFEELMSLVKTYRDFVERVKPGEAVGETELRAAAAAAAECDLAYIEEDAPSAIRQSLEGVERVAHIVRAMRDFSHVDTEEAVETDLNKCINTTLTVARNEYKYVADVATELGELPSVQCFPGKVNQVLLNMVVNAAHAIGDTKTRGTITIRSRLCGDEVEISISDTGTGIPEAIRGRIFDPFFTTKEIGRGTGQGLYIAHQIIVRKHGGSLSFDTELGKGTTFHIRIPVKRPEPASEQETQS